MKISPAARALLKVLALFVFQLTGIVCCLLLLAFLFGLSPAELYRKWQLPEPVASIYGVCFFLLAVSNILLCHRYLNGQPSPLRALGLWPVRGRLLLAGWLLGTALLAGLYGAELLVGWLQWGPAALSPWGAFQLLGGSLLLGLVIGVMEELLFRGYILQTLLTGLPRWLAVLLASFIYALLHFIRPGLNAAELLQPLAGLTLVGACLCQAYFLTGSLWLSIGLHAGWVFVISATNQWHLWGIAPDYLWLTGGNYPVTGLLGSFMLLGLLGTLVKTKSSAGTG